MTSPARAHPAANARQYVTLVSVSTFVGLTVGMASHAASASPPATSDDDAVTTAVTSTPTTEADDDGGIVGAVPAPGGPAVTPTTHSHGS